MKQAFGITAALLVSMLSTGCASIVNGQSQVVAVETVSKGQPVVGASCKLVNPKGTFFVTTPGSVTIHRAYDNLSITCEKDGILPGIASVKSGTKAMAFGNILFGGVIGAAVDVGTGAAYDYPSLITVDMGAASTEAAASIIGATESPGTATQTAAASQK